MERARKVKKMWHEIYALLQEGKSMPNAVEEVNYPLTRRGATVAAVHTKVRMRASYWPILIDIVAETKD
jgi:hypothetical protein